MPIAQKLREQGHEVLFLVRDTATAGQLLDPCGFSFCQAPICLNRKRLARPPANYAEMLIAAGYFDEALLRGLVRGWLSMVELFEADLVVVDHSPTALLACRLSGTPCIVVGNGFEIPPALTPLPSIRPWEAISDQRLQQADAFVLKHINATVSGLGGSALTSITELFAGSTKLLATFAELDHYGTRNGVRYIGPIFSALPGRTVTWRQSDKKRIFCYLRPDTPGFLMALKVLSTFGAKVILVAPGIEAKYAEELASNDFLISRHPVTLEGLLNTADLVVSFGETGMVSLSLLVGVPLLLLPQNVEQYLIGLGVEKLGAGLLVREPQNENRMRELLTGLLAEPSFRHNAGGFAARYAGFDSNCAVEIVVNQIRSELTQPA
ncbi:MAG: hypothetical protein PHH11_16365 [Methylomonas sp.]|nr:hypothetical protein [Methylomonas sp.]